MGRIPRPRRLQDWWFYGTLAASTGLVLYLFRPFLDALLFASVLVVVSWPLNLRMRAAVGGRAGLASALTMLLLLVLVFGPLGVLGWLAAREAAVITQGVADWFRSGELEAFLARVDDYRSWLPGWVSRRIDPQFEPVALITSRVDETVLTVLNSAGGFVPRVVDTVFTITLDVVMFLFAVATLYVHGPRVLRFIETLSPMDDRYDRRLFEVFARFAHNVILGSLASACIQGVIAAIGYNIAGVERVAFLAILTAVGSFVPIVGTAAVWIPVSIGVGISEGPASAIFVAVWSALLTGSVDNVVKPLFVRGSSHIHPLLIFLAIFGGLSWMGLPGLIVGPVLVAFFLALYTIYVEDFLQRPAELFDEEDRGPGWIQRLIRWLKVRLGRSQPRA